MRFVLILLSAVLLFSCVKTKRIVYLQTGLSEDVDSLTVQHSVEEYKLQVNDIIDVQVKSLEENLNNMFNISNGKVNPTQAANVGAGDLFYLTGYLIDKEGDIELPLVGKVKAVGLTIPELKSKLKLTFNKLFKEELYYLSVKLGGIRYSALGEFNRAGKYVLLQSNPNIFEAIANAGDLTTVASRNNVKLIRQYSDGVKIHELNLLDVNVINSPYYYLKPNDIIYVEPLKVKSWGVGTFGAQTLTLIMSLVTSTVVVLTYIQNTSK